MIFDKELDLAGAKSWDEAEKRIARHIQYVQERAEVKVTALERRVAELEKKINQE